MPNSYSASSSLPFLMNFSARERQAAERALSKREAARRSANQSRARKAELLVEGVQRQLHNLLGARKFAAMREGLQQQRLGFRDLMQPPAGLKRDYTRQRAASRKKADALLRKLGANPSKVNKIISAADAKFESAFLPDHRKVASGVSMNGNLAKWTKLSPLHAFPLPWGVFEQVEDPNNPHRWFLFRPPFFGFLFDEDIVTSSNFTANRQMFLHPPTALVGNACTMDGDDTGSFDLAHVIGEAQIAFGFTPPVTGLIEVLIDAQALFGTHFLEIEDEFGFSEAWCNQNNYLMMDVLHPNVPVSSLALMSNMSKETGGDDLTASQETLTRGQHYFAQLFSSGPVPAGQRVVITVGTRTFDICRADDMALFSHSNFRWFINSIEVRISP
jgi:hypothetical protein